jgi:hypothetical protein
VWELLFVTVMMRDAVATCVDLLVTVMMRDSIATCVGDAFHYSNDES